MTTDLTFNTDALFKSVSYDSVSDSWTFFFLDNIYASSSGFWRLLKDKALLAISFDHGHQFGLNESLNLIEIVTNELTGNRLIQIIVEKNVGDLTLMLSSGFEIKIFIASMGYETYHFRINKTRYIGLGGGADLAIIEVE